LLLRDDGRIVPGASPETVRDQQMVKLDQRCLRLSTQKDENKMKAKPIPPEIVARLSAN
jgi:hypothetical protein